MLNERTIAQYGSFAYTGLVYLNDHGTDFQVRTRYCDGTRRRGAELTHARWAGRFVRVRRRARGGRCGSARWQVRFTGPAMCSPQVAPLAGRLNMFTSGSENVHRVTRVTNGTRFALTVAFTCDPNAAITPEQAYRERIA